MKQIVCRLTILNSTSNDLACVVILPIDAAVVAAADTAHIRSQNQRGSAVAIPAVDSYPFRPDHRRTKLHSLQGKTD